MAKGSKQLSDMMKAFDKIVETGDPSMIERARKAIAQAEEAGNIPVNLPFGKPTYSADQIGKGGIKEVDNSVKETVNYKLDPTKSANEVKETVNYKIDKDAMPMNIKEGVNLMSPGQANAAARAGLPGGGILDSFMGDLGKMNNALTAKSSAGTAIKDVAGIADKYASAPIRNSISAFMNGQSPTEAVAKGLEGKESVSSNALSKDILAKLAERGLVPQPTMTADPLTGEVEKKSLLESPLETAIDAGADVTNLIPGSKSLAAAPGIVGKLSKLTSFLGK